MDVLSLMIAAILIVSLVGAVAAIGVLIIIRKSRVNQDQSSSSSQSTSDDLRESIKNIERQFYAFEPLQKQRLEEINRSLDKVEKRLNELIKETNEQLNKNRDSVDFNLQNVRLTIDQQLGKIRTDTSSQLEQMRNIVDEKLQKTLNARITESFKIVNDQLDKVGRGLGEMQTLATDVGGLKKVLSGVKTRGNLGEIQLSAILEEILAPQQYEKNVATVPESTERVEFAVKIPGNDGETIWLPIDSKFPAETYHHLLDAQDQGDLDAINLAWKELENRVKADAKNIHDKYLEPPATTSFGIMFLPFEGLYSEVVSRQGLIEEIQRRYQVNVAGPSTMAALLSSLQMGFQTVAIQKRASEIQKVLEAVKTEFKRYHQALEKASKQLGTASKTVDELLGTRTKKINKALEKVSTLDDVEQAEDILGIESTNLLYDDQFDEE